VKRGRGLAFTATVAAALALLLPALPAVAMPNGPPGPPKTLPVRELTAAQTDVLLDKPDLVTTWLSSLTLKTAAMVRADAIAPGSAGQDVERATGAVAAVYASDVKSSVTDSGHAGPTEPVAGELFNFKVSGDAAQAWATMSASGHPFLMLWALGQSSGHAVASWRTGFTVGGPNSQQVYLQMPMPGVTVTGVNEADGPSLWRSRFRADLMVNGFPGWSTDVVRFNELNSYGSDDSGEKARHLTVFGSPTLGHTDGSGETSDGSTPKTLMLYLGTFPAGSTIDVSLVMRAEARVETACDVETEELFCTRATVRTIWPTTRSPGTRFLTRPAPSYPPPLSDQEYPGFYPGP
jgi:hypothetical protein